MSRRSPASQLQYFAAFKQNHTMRYGEGFMHLYSFYYLYVFPDNKDVNTEKYRNITVHCFDSG